MGDKPMKTHSDATRWHVLLLTAGATLLAGCAGNGVRVDQETGADLSRCTSFAWSQPGAEPASLTDQRIRDAALETLRARGYQVVERDAGCGVSYAIDLSTRSRSRSSIGFGLGGGSGNFGGGVGVSLPIGAKLRAATVRVNISDNARQTQIWTAALDTEVSDPVSLEQATVIVSKILASYQDRSVQQKAP